jgi:hypothetical protein
MSGKNILDNLRFGEARGVGPGLDGGDQCLR